MAECAEFVTVTPHTVPASAGLKRCEGIGFDFQEHQKRRHQTLAARTIDRDRYRVEICVYSPTRALRFTPHTAQRLIAASRGDTATDRSALLGFRAGLAEALTDRPGDLSRSLRDDAFRPALQLGVTASLRTHAILEHDFSLVETRISRNVHYALADKMHQAHAEDEELALLRRFASHHAQGSPGLTPVAPGWCAEKTNTALMNMMSNMLSDKAFGDRNLELVHRVRGSAAHVTPDRPLCASTSEAKSPRYERPPSWTAPTTNTRRLHSALTLAAATCHLADPAAGPMLSHRTNMALAVVLDTEYRQALGALRPR